MTLPSTYNSALRDELLLMRAEDERVSDELAADGSLYKGYHPRIVEVHRKTGELLSKC